jgi:DNA-binding helix-hairpin-helix protein with protein kinase domain
MGSAAMGPIASLRVRALFDNAEGMQRYRVAFQNADTRWKAAQREWETKAGSTPFQAKKSAMVELRRQLQDIPTERLRKLDHLKRQRRQHQLEKFLDQFEIDDATIENIGAGRKRTLESYGIETAADIVASKIESVPGFGPRLRSNLTAWRDKIETRFRFDPNKEVDSQEITKVEHEIATKRKSLQTQLTTGVVELKALANRIDVARRGMRAQVEAIQREHAQATADYAAVKRTE